MLNCLRIRWEASQFGDVTKTSKQKTVQRKRQIMETAIATAILALFQVWANHTKKPEGWKPTPQDVQDILSTVDAATPAAEKAKARQRLGLPPV